MLKKDPTSWAVPGSKHAEASLFIAFAKSWLEGIGNKPALGLSLYFNTRCRYFIDLHASFYKYLTQVWRVSYRASGISSQVFAFRFQQSGL